LSRRSTLRQVDWGSSRSYLWGLAFYAAWAHRTGDDMRPAANPQFTLILKDGDGGEGKVRLLQLWVLMNE